MSPGNFSIVPHAFPHRCCVCHVPVGVPEKKFAYAYCHGFLSGPGSVKGQALRESLLEKGVDLSLLNLNGEDDDPGAITCSGAVGAVRAFHLGHKSASGNPGLKLRLAGSSLGGYIAARSANRWVSCWLGSMAERAKIKNYAHKLNHAEASAVMYVFDLLLLIPYPRNAEGRVAYLLCLLPICSYLIPFPLECLGARRLPAFQAFRK